MSTIKEKIRGILRRSRKDSKSSAKEALTKKQSVSLRPEPEIIPETKTSQPRLESSASVSMNSSKSSDMDNNKKEMVRRSAPDLEFVSGIISEDKRVSQDACDPPQRFRGSNDSLRRYRRQFSTKEFVGKIVEDDISESLEESENESGLSMKKQDMGDDDIKETAE